jgi:predicted ArsR family transcriptional regulator
MEMLRVSPHTVDELAAELGVTDNAVRPHIAALEKEGLAQQAGSRRGEGAGKPATVYELHSDAEPLLSRADAPGLGAVREVIGDALDPRTAKRLLRETGRRLASTVGGRATGDLSARAKAAAAVLTALGGHVTVEKKHGAMVLRGTACPLASAVSRNPRVCHAVESLVGEISGAAAREHCDRAERPRCCFELTA